MRDPLKVLNETGSCDYPEIRKWKLSTDDQVALHTFKHELIAAGYRLYGKMPAAKAALVLNKVFIEFASNLAANEPARAMDAIAGVERAELN
jgi:hypothetical protein